jgi:ABC-type spermidine/putrescine transport system permease subunit II
MATLAASFGTLIVFIGAYVVEKARRDIGLRKALQMLMLLPMAIQKRLIQFLNYLTKNMYNQYLNYLLSM